MNNYEQAIDTIIKGAKRLREVCEGDESGAVYQEIDAESTFLRVPVGAFCLKLAYRIWQDQQVTRQNSLLGMMGAGVGKQWVPQPETEEIEKMQKKTLQTPNGD